MKKLLVTNVFVTTPSHATAGWTIKIISNNTFLCVISVPTYSSCTKFVKQNLKISRAEHDVCYYTCDSTQIYTRQPEVSHLTTETNYSTKLHVAISTRKSVLSPFWHRWWWELRNSLAGRIPERHDVHTKFHRNPLKAPRKWRQMRMALSSGLKLEIQI